MKQPEFVKWLKEQGVKVTNGGNHCKVYYNGKQTTVPRHPSKEIDNLFARRIAKQLGLDFKL